MSKSPSTRDSSYKNILSLLEKIFGGRLFFKPYKPTILFLQNRLYIKMNNHRKELASYPLAGTSLAAFQEERAGCPLLEVPARRPLLEVQTSRPLGGTDWPSTIEMWVGCPFHPGLAGRPLREGLAGHPFP
ncbi:hypothetical protein ACH5RR_015510 [Cinchona calisaya]|uniref:Uncharacterized protein n=1 Tax=Cinchona calisaya TaxID=153742 RepID=A0ABD2ZTB7_9GENT